MELVPQLIERISKARGKQKLVDLLRQIKAVRDVKIRTTGTVDELEASLQGAVIDGHVTLDQLRDLVDEIEETGAQHLFLYDLTAAGVKELTAAVLADAFSSPPKNVTPALYGDAPATRIMFIGDRRSELIVKQVYTGSFWEEDEGASENTETRRVKVTVRRDRRAVNLLRIVPSSRTAEIRVDRLKNANDRRLALDGLKAFQQHLKNIVNFEQHLTPINIRPAFPRIVAADDETLMLTDQASDASAKQAFSSRRDGPRTGTDIRKHVNWKLQGNKYLRDALHVYWRIDAGKGSADEGHPVYTIISALPDADVELCKVYLSAKVSPSELNHVIARIRHFASQSS